MEKKTHLTFNSFLPRRRLQVLCDKYWPMEGGAVQYGLVQVTRVGCRQGPDYLVTTLNLRQVRTNTLWTSVCVQRVH